MPTNNTSNGIYFTVKALVDEVEVKATHGTLIMAIDDANVQGIHTYKKLKKVVENYEDENKAYIARAFSDYGVHKVMVVSGHDGSTGITGSLPDILKLLNKVYENGYLIAPQIVSDTDKKLIADFVKSQRNDEDYPLKAVLYNYKADSEGIVNFTGKNLQGKLVEDETADTKTSNEYCVDVASYLCTLGANESITSHVAKNVTNCDAKDDNDDCVANGELYLYNDGVNIVFSRGVNSLQTIPAEQNEKLTKIRMVETIDLVKTDIKTMFSNYYSGRIGNSYSNRKTLVNVINSYLRGLSKMGYLSNDNASTAELDIEATRNYLETVKGKDTDEMKDMEILQADIDSHVFIKILLRTMDSMEDFYFAINYSA